MRPEVKSQKSEARSKKAITNYELQFTNSKSKIVNLKSQILSLLAAYCLLLTVLSGCLAITAEEDPLKKDMDSLKGDTRTQQQRLIQLEEASKKGIDLQIKRLDLIEESSQREKANVKASIDKIKEDMSFLNGRLEDIGFEIKKTKENMALQQEKSGAGLQAQNVELNSRLSAIQNQLSALEKRLISLDEKVVVLEDKAATAAGQTSKETSKQEVKPQSPNDLYNEAILLIKDKDYSNALEKLAAFLSLFPEHDLAQNARYWTGEIYYAQKDYERAVLEFNEVVKKYPKSNKIPAALLKQGMAFSELGNKKEARLVLEKVIDKYADTDEAKKAKKALKEMK